MTSFRQQTPDLMYFAFATDPEVSSDAAQSLPKRAARKRPSTALTGYSQDESAAMQMFICFQAGWAHIDEGRRDWTDFFCKEE